MKDEGGGSENREETNPSGRINSLITNDTASAENEKSGVISGLYLGIE
jgi:hypothetical protein